jgi:ubiquinone/menaquinone biosynthesis C-methylase UbiE
MTQELHVPDVSRFNAVDQTADPAVMVAFLEAAAEIPGLRELKVAMLAELCLDKALTALDVGCGLGADAAEMAGRMPKDGRVTGIDNSAAMIGEARRRSADLGNTVTFDVGNAMDLPYADASFDACRAKNVFQHLPGPELAIGEMSRVTRSGGRVAALEFDLGTELIDHPDRETTTLILGARVDEAVQGWIGRQLPRLFRQAGLTSVAVTPSVILTGMAMARMIFGRTVDRLVDQGAMTASQAQRWWAELERQAAGSGEAVAGAAIFLVSGAKP